MFHTKEIWCLKDQLKNEFTTIGFNKPQNLTNVAILVINFFRTGVSRCKAIGHSVIQIYSK